MMPRTGEGGARRIAGCGGRVVSVACDAGVQYGNLSDAVAASDSHRCHD